VTLILCVPEGGKKGDEEVDDGPLRAWELGGRNREEIGEGLQLHMDPSGIVNEHWPEPSKK